MKAKGNGTPEQCVQNLILITRGEVPYERIKGIDGDLIDSPAATAGDDMVADAEWLLNTYEPRVQVNSIEANENDGVGDFGIVADISINQQEEEDDEA